MSHDATQKFKVALGLLLGAAIGALCRWIGIPSPAPTAMPGALLVVAMTLGYIATDRFMQREARHRALCGGPDGALKKRA